MPAPPPSGSLEASLHAHIGYLRDLGVFDLYRRAPTEVAFGSPRDAATTSEVATVGDTPVESATALPLAAPSALTGDDEESSISPRKLPSAPLPFVPGPLIAPKLRGKVLAVLQSEIGECTRCPLGFAGRRRIVFGDGDPNAHLLFVGEGPGADEDAQGVPFVGRAGQLLNNMITAMGLAREQVYIANVVKCRPPENRVPEPVEAHTCTQFLFRQIDIIRPRVIVALGSTAATYLLGVKSSLSALRGRTHTTPIHPGAKVIVTYHPAYLLRDPRQKKEAWGDLQTAMAVLREKD